MKDGMSIMFLAKIGKTEKFPGLNASGLKIKLQGTTFLILTFIRNLTAKSLGRNKNGFEY